jgi:hypothetical protein
MNYENFILKKTHSTHVFIQLKVALNIFHGVKKIISSHNKEKLTLFVKKAHLKQRFSIWVAQKQIWVTWRV